MSTFEQKYDTLLKDYITLEVKYDRLELKLTECHKAIKQLQEMVANQQKEITLLRQQVNDLMGLGKKRK